MEKDEDKIYYKELSLEEVQAMINDIEESERDKEANEIRVQCPGFTVAIIGDIKDIKCNLFKIIY